jgi:VLTF3-like late transcription factor
MAYVFDLIEAYISKYDENDKPFALLPFIPLMRGEMDEQLLLELGKIPVYDCHNNLNKYECQMCGSRDLDTDHTAAEIICIDCGIVQPFIEAVIGYEGYKNVSFQQKSIYCSVKYLNLLLDELSCKSCKIDYEMIEKVSIHVGDDISYINVRKCLRKLGYMQSYLKIPTILFELDKNKFPAVKLTAVERNRLEFQFKQYLDAFNRLMGKYRKNGLSLHFVLLKLAKMNKIEMGHALHPPKGPASINRHESIWKEICILNKWIYI